MRDLKVDALFSPQSLRVMRELPSRGDALRRQDMFAELKNDALRQQLHSVSEALDGFERQNSAYTAAEDGGVRAITFVCACALFAALCSKAAALDARSELLSRFSAHFKDTLSDGGVKKMIAALSEMSDFDTESRFTVTRGDGKLVFVSEAKTGLDDTLRALCGVAARQNIGPVPCEGTFAAHVAKTDRARLEKATKFFESFKDTYDRVSVGVSIYTDELAFISDAVKLRANAQLCGIALCTPKLDDSRAVAARGVSDLTLLTKGEREIVPNDVALTADEPLFFLSGANGGGKTTYLRAVGVNVILALSGADAAAEKMSVGRVDGVFTHFPSDEHFEGEGRFANEKRRADEMISAFGATPLALLNETFSTTAQERSRAETNALAARLKKSGALGVYVTHTDGVCAEGVGSLVCLTDPDDAGRRTYRIARANGGYGAHADDILKKYSLTADGLKKRLSGGDGQ